MPRAGTVVIDTRPLWIVLLARSGPVLMLALGVVIFWVIKAWPAPAGLEPPAQAALAVFGLCIFYWIFEVLPIMITGLLVIVLLPLTGVMPNKEAYAQFGNEAVFFILGAFMLAAAMMKSGLSARLALTILRRFGHRPAAMLLAIYLLNGVMSFFMSEHAVAAMTFPIVLEIATALKLRSWSSNYGRALFLALAWGTSLGGVGTLLGGARAPLAIGMLREVSGRGYSFGEWAALNVPFSLALLAAGWVLLRFWFPIDLTDISAAERAIDERLQRTGRMTLQEVAIALIMLGTVICWIVLGEEFGLANIALAAVALLFVFNVVQWRDIEGYVNWGLILMYGGAIALGAALNRSGAAGWLSQATLAQWAIGPTSVAFLISFAALVFTEVMSNSAAVAILMPVSVAVAAQFGLDVRAMAPLVAVPAGMGLMLPIGTPANAIAYSSGYLRIADMVFPGLVMDLIALLIFNLFVYFYWPLVGISL